MAKKKGHPKPPARAAKPRPTEDVTAAKLPRITTMLAPISRMDLEGFLQRRALHIFLALVILGSIRIISTYNVFSHTIDEPAHIACGMQWLDKKVYEYEPQHPPLARLMTALGPYLAGSRSLGLPRMYEEGAQILSRGNRYDRTLALARLGILPFFWIGSFAVFWWTRRHFGAPAALFATLCFTFVPPVLGHAGLATTDMALTGCLGLSFAAMLAWLENPSWARSAIFGAASGAAIISKFSALPFFASIAAATLIFYLAIEQPNSAKIVSFLRSHSLPLLLAISITCLVIWGGYRFGSLHQFFAGLKWASDHNRSGHPSYFLGKHSETGWWYYYPVVLAVKTPLALIALVAIGVFVCWKRRRENSAAYLIPAAFTLGLLILAAFSRINIGVRHVLPVYIAFSVLGGIAAQWMWTSGVIAQCSLIFLTLWMCLSSAWSHPDYFPYFNELAGAHPEKIVVDSDLDWGQDLKRLAARMQQLRVSTLPFNPFALNPEIVPEIPTLRVLDPFNHPVGLAAGSLTEIWLKDDPPNHMPWTKTIPPTERLGKGMVLWYFPEPKP